MGYKPKKENMNGSLPVYRECCMEEMTEDEEDEEEEEEEDEKVRDTDDESEPETVILWRTMVDFCV